jgi:adenosylcobinamide-GDP ribazoletransferase
MLNQFVVAWHFLTAIPVSRRHQRIVPEQLARSMIWFPAVGLVLGGILAGAMFLFEMALPRSISDGLVMLLLILLTRCLHLDGLADTVDGWAGGRTPEERLAIMRDPSIGAMGAVALIVSLGLRYLGLSALPDAGRWIAVTSMPLVGRWAMTVGGLKAPYARAEGGLAQPFLAALKTEHIVVATIFAGLWLIWGYGLTGGLSILAVGGLIARGIARLSLRLCRGITGDVFGMINEVTEVAFLIVVPSLLGRR